MKERDIQRQLGEIEQAKKEIQLKEEHLREQEASLRDKRTQLFKSYDSLTEKIYQFERECEKIKVKKREIVIQQQKVNQQIQDRFKELEAKHQMLLEIKLSISTQQNPNIEVSKIAREKLKRNLSMQIKQVAKMQNFIDSAIDVIGSNRDYLSQKAKQMQNQPTVSLPSVNEALEIAFNQNNRLNINEQTNSLLKSGFNAGSGESKNTISDLNKAIIIPVEELRIRSDIMREEGSSNFEDSDSFVIPDNKGKDAFKRHMENEKSINLEGTYDFNKINAQKGGIFDGLTQDSFFGKKKQEGMDSLDLKSGTSSKKSSRRQYKKFLSEV